MNDQNQKLFNQLKHKGNLKLDIYDVALDVFQQFKEQAKSIVSEYDDSYKDSSNNNRVAFTYKDKGEFEFELKFGGDVLLFLMHTNIFEIPRANQLMGTRYVKEDKERSYGGLIHIYNFLADSFKYGRENDMGYLIGRMMVNKEKHYFIEGKKEIGMIYHNFEKSILNTESIHKIITSSIEYTLNFDLLIPPYEAVSLISVMDLNLAMQGSPLKTGKRLGFKFQADKKEVKGQLKKE